MFEKNLMRLIEEWEMTHLLKVTVDQEGQGQMPEASK